MKLCPKVRDHMGKTKLFENYFGGKRFSNMLITIFKEKTS